MAGDWIAMRHDLWECPQVVRILSAMCPQDVHKMSERCRIVGALYRTWQLVDRYANDGILHGYTAETLNDSVGIDGWAENLQHVGWLVIEPQSLVIPEFESWFSSSAKRRMSDAKRKRLERRSASAICPKTLDKKRTREEKRREEKSKKENPLPPSENGQAQKPKRPKKPVAELVPNFPAALDVHEFRDCWRDWVSYCTEKRKKLTQKGQDCQLRRLGEWGLPRACAAVRFSMAQQYDGIYEEKKDRFSQTPEDDKAAFQRTMDEWEAKKNQANQEDE